MNIISIAITLFLLVSNVVDTQPSCSFILNKETSSQTMQTSNKPLLVVVIMVKDEEHVIEETLKPFIESGIDAFLVFDTGSTDNTLEVTKQFFLTQKAALSKAVIVQEPFLDFARSRNRALELTEQYFSNATFMIMPDAEWYIKHVDALIQFCKDNQNSTCPGYLIRITLPSLEFDTMRLIRCRSGLRFVGSVHECINYCTKERVPHPVHFEYVCSNKGFTKSKDRYKQDLELLLKDYKENSHNPRTAFYLAQTYECLGDTTMAYAMYAHRVTLVGWDEENYIALYRLARLTEKLTPEDAHWPLAESRYLKAYDMRPHRAEPLIKIAQHYLHINNPRCFIYAQRACQLAYPKDEILFVDKHLYDYTRYDILGQAAWYVGEYQIGEEALRTILKKYPDDPHLQRNLKFYTERNCSSIQQNQY